MNPLSGWGRYPRIATEIVSPRDATELPRWLTGREGLIARGLGRSYGDAAIGACTTLMTNGLDRMRAFNPATGCLDAEAGLSLAEILRCFVPRGYFPSVVPGTRHVTLGGMIASDVHGKNHHRDGGFGAQVESLTLMLADGSRRRCSRDENAELFRATIGGMGLTGTILDASFRLNPIETGWIVNDTSVAEDLSEAMSGLETSADATYSVAWIDCLARGSKLGRGLVYRGEHARKADLDRLGSDLPQFPSARIGRLSVPFDMPSFTLNRASVTAFNALYARRGQGRAGQPQLVPWSTYFFPLDGLSHWNRLYGSRGFLQHQCVIPLARAHAAVSEILDRVARLGTASPLAVLKQLGRGEGLMSFPIEGYTLALDLPASSAAFALLDELDRLVVEAGGRLYLAKDARQSRRTFEAGYPNLFDFRTLRKHIGAQRSIASHMSLRLGLQ